MTSHVQYCDVYGTVGIRRGTSLMDLKYILNGLYAATFRVLCDVEVVVVVNMSFCIIYGCCSLAALFSYYNFALA